MIARAAMLALLVLSACTHRDRIAVLAASAAVATACDVRQTMEVSDGGRWDWPGPAPNNYTEGNPMLGPTPSPAVLAGSLVMVQTAIIWVAQADRIPTWSKYVLLGAMAVGEGLEVRRMAPVAGICGGRRRWP